MVKVNIYINLKICIKDLKHVTFLIYFYIMQNKYIILMVFWELELHAKLLEKTGYLIKIKNNFHYFIDHLAIFFLNADHTR